MRRLVQPSAHQLQPLLIC